MKMNSEAGISLAEILVASAIGLAIVSVLGTAIFQFFTVTSHGSDVMTAMHQVQNAGHWVCLDGQRSSQASAGDDLVLTIPNSSTITYSVSNNELVRISAGNQLTVARYVSDVDFNVDGRIITMSVTSDPDGESNVNETATYKVFLRPTAEGS